MRIRIFFLFISILSCAQTSNTYLEKHELQKKSINELQLIYNKLYAKHGYIFKDSIVLAHFNQKEWYKPNHKFVMLTNKEKGYMKLVQKIEKNKNDKHIFKSLNKLQSSKTAVIEKQSLYLYLEYPIYIINKNHVVYQDAKTRKIIYPDLKTFRRPNNIDESGIALDKNGVYYKGEFLKIDTTGVEIVGRNDEYSNYQWLWKTKYKAFKNSQELKEVDATTFTAVECLNGSYFKDKNFIYYFDKKIEGSDGSSVNETCNDLCYDKNYVYKNGEKLTHNNENLKPVNEFLFKTSSIVINRDNIELPNVDAPSLRALTQKYSMDKNGLYYEDKLTKVKPENIKNIKVWDQARAYYTDGIHVYANQDYLEPDYDAVTFGMLPHSGICYDKNGIYVREYTKERGVFNEKFPFEYTDLVSDKNTFITTNNDYIIYKDQAYSTANKKVYLNLTPEKITLIKNGGFLVEEKKENIVVKKDLGYNYYKLDNKIYNNDKELKQVDVNSFEPITYYYSKDKDFVYIYAFDEFKIFKGIDVHNFELYPNTPFAVDDSFLYYGTKEIITSKGLQLHAIFSGYRMGCSLDTESPTNFYFFENSKGFWLVETNDIIKPKFLGKEFNPKWNLLFENFELAKKDKK